MSSVTETLKRFLILLTYQYEAELGAPAASVLIAVILLLFLSLSPSAGFLPSGEAFTVYSHVTAVLSNWFLLLVIGGLFGFTLARHFGNRRIITSLTLPIRRIEYISSKFVSNFLILLATLSLAYVLDVMVLSGQRSGAALCALLLVTLLQLLFSCSVALLSALLSKNVVITTLSVPATFWLSLA